TRLALIAPK
nr:Chain C, Pre-MRNA Processing Factor 3 [Homo sapiens]7N2R_C Chain C, Pre-MRNA Processing Factor 3 [Homo sapiens]7N2S_C Chain C, Pre-MRNA Processing Factor 3 [Homo sapiens]